MRFRSWKAIAAPWLGWWFVAVMTSTSIRRMTSFPAVDAAPFNEKKSYSKTAMAPNSTNCDATDFELPQALMDVFESEDLPPFLTPEIFATVAVLQDGWAPGFAATETPIISRLVQLIDKMNWNCVAVYSSTWKDAISKEDPKIPTPVDHPAKGIVFHSSATRQLCMVHAWATVVLDWFPNSYPSLSGMLGAFGYNVTYGFNPEVNAAVAEEDLHTIKSIAATNCYSPKIMGAIIGKQVTEYGRDDGWNMYGTIGRDGKPCEHNCRRFTDTTQYRPLGNRPLEDDEIGIAGVGRKYRWVPMLEDDNRGYFSRQMHVTPHIGTTAKRAVLSDEEYNARMLEPTGVMYDYDAEARLVAKRLAVTATDDMKKAQVEFYDDKVKVVFAIAGSIASYAPSFEQLINFVMGLTAGEYDSVLVAWKVKVATDLIRPTSWIQDEMGEEEFNTYAGPYKGNQTIKGKNFEAYVRVMPHSEYISGSACICQALRDFTDEWMERTHGELLGTGNLSTFVPGGSIAVPIATDETGRDPPFLMGSSRTEPGFAPAANLTLVAMNMTDLRDQCGNSRLDGGMHFTDAVPDAYELCEGIGTLAAEYSLSLIAEGGWADEAEGEGGSR